ncbi:MarR family winged helix-turn-helix transcriptional regulator [Egicoccus halophilus]|uniref:MarR family transcriptional regulator n=1 Tax=Egicoccus halophilus TaxID=1670830 RepID=A0A8J3EYN9_9ACTN|nr:MarR family transcriptional regulator [Egicoccus halophilus]GGI08264.1 MarR family transcriptional regulator [Egicoccus halophilus]
MDTSPAPRWLDEREAHAWRSYTRMRVQLQARLAQALQRRSGLSEPDYDVLVHLSEAPDARLRPFQLGQALQWEKSRLSHQLTRMARRGLVARHDCDTDGRGAYVVLTPAGLAAIEAAAPAHVDDVRRHLVDALTPQQLEALADIADTVLANLQRLEADEMDAEAEAR